MRAANPALRLRQPPLPGQRQVTGGHGQGDFDEYALALCAAPQHAGLQHGFSGHQRAAHVGIQRGGQFQAGHQAVFGQIGQVVAGFFSTFAGAADDGDLRQGRVARPQRFPVNTQFLERRRAK